ncbi:MAG: hypothetical protein LH606_11155 [Cytophagaceae bacterium]|nr:hypothetical protein [Cytophagaceae bacterium]
MPTNPTLFLLLIVFAFGACDPKKIDTKGMAQEMRNREPKRITPSQLAVLAAERGSQLADSLNRLPDSPRDTAVVNNLARHYGAEVRFLTLDKPDADPDPKVREVLAAYRYSAQNHLSAEPNLQKLKDGAVWLYTAPVLQSDSLAGLWMITFSRKELILRAD